MKLVLVSVLFTIVVCASMFDLTTAKYVGSFQHYSYQKVVFLDNPKVTRGPVYDCTKEDEANDRACKGECVARKRHSGYCTEKVCVCE